MAKDFLDKTVEVGDTVVFMEIGYRNFLLGKVLKIGTKKFTISYVKNPARTTYQYFNQVVKVEV